MASKMSMAVGLSLIVLFVAFMFPIFIHASDDGRVSERVNVGNGTGNVVDVEGAFRVIMTDKTSSTADINVTSLRSGNQTSLTVTEGETVSFEMDDETINVTGLSIQSGSDGEVLLEFNYPVTFGWIDSTTRLSGLMPIVFAALAVLIVAGIIAKAVGS